MALILGIETATKTCSVALFQNGKLLSSKEEYDIQSHAGLLTIFIDQLLKESNKTNADLEAVAISIGPGSYTGLRIGLSAAKGLCYALNIPLIEVNTLKYLCDTMIEKTPKLEALYISAMDARRDEIYAIAINSKREIIFETTPMVLEKNSFSSLDYKDIYISGNGAEKTINLCSETSFIHLEHLELSAKLFCTLASQKFENKVFADVAYLEPQYLKPFMGTKPKKTN